MKQEELEELASDIDDAVDELTGGETITVSTELLFRMHRAIRYFTGSVRVLDLVKRLSVPLVPFDLSTGSMRTVEEALKQEETTTYLRVLEDHGGNVSAAAKAMKTDRTTFYRKIGRPRKRGTQP